MGGEPTVGMVSDSFIQTYQDNSFSDSFITQDKLLETCKYYHILYPALHDKTGDFF